MRADHIPNDEAEESSIYGVKQVVSGDVGALAIGVQHAFQVEGQRQVLTSVVDQRGGVAALQVCWLVELFSLADEVPPFLLQDQLADGVAHFFLVHHHRLQRH